MNKFFNPKSVAVIGASSKENKVGFSLVRNLAESGSCQVYPVTLNEGQILGLQTYRSVSDINDEIDLAIIAVPASKVPDVLVECGQKTISNVIIISSGFKEIGIEGKILEEKIASIAAEHQIRVLGPNCLGLINNSSGLNASFSSQKPLPGKISFLSQSGALGTAIIDWSRAEGIGFSKFVSLGNEAQLTEIEFLEYLEDDPDTGAILMYLENIKDGKRFFETVSRITPKKPVVIIKAGMGSHGNLAVLSHTGSLAPQPAVFIAACKQAGAITVSSLRGFFNIVKVLSQGVSVEPPVQKLIILTNGGGPSVVAADLIDRSRSLSLILLSENDKESLREILPRAAAVGNPVDIIGDALAERYDKSMAILSQVSDADGIIVMLTPQMMTQPAETARALAKYKDQKKIFPVFMGGEGVEEGRRELIKLGLCHFPFARDVVDALDYIARGAAKIKNPLLHHASTVASSSNAMMEFQNSLSMLRQYGLEVSGKFLRNKEDLGGALSALGEGPYAMKAISSAALHKTESGVVRLNVGSLEQAYVVWEELWTNPAVVGKVEGILVQNMEERGREVIIGMKRDDTFGPTLLFGIGGIWAEAIKDTAIRLAPISKEEALKMMKEIKGIKILEGMRGQAPVNFDKLADIIVHLSRLALDHPEIKEVDLNPVICSENSAVLVDARMMI